EQVEQHLGVGARAEAVALLLQLEAQLLEVVDLAVEDDPQRAILAAHGLMAGRGEIDDAQPAVAEPDRAVAPDACVVGPAMGDHVAHALDQARVDVPALLEDPLTRDPAHGDLPPALGALTR